MDVNLLSVFCNENDTKFHSKKENNCLAIYIGDENEWLNEGKYDYTILYESYGHIGFSDDHDELYWNVTGNDWVFPIEQASAAITLPCNVTAINTYAYTGSYGDSEKDFLVEDGGNIQVFSTTRQLYAKEGLTVAVTFPRDIVKRPPPPTKAQIFWNKYIHHICFPMSLLVCISFIFYSFRKVGKRPEKRLIIPIFTPPRKLSPADLNYLSKRIYDTKAFTASLVEMAVKGAISIHCKKLFWHYYEYTLENKKDTSRLRHEEEQIHKKLFADGENKVIVSQKYRSKFSKAQTSLKESLETKWNFKDFFNLNGKYSALFFFLIICVTVLYMFLTAWVDENYGLPVLFFILMFIGFLPVFTFRIRRFTPDGAILDNEIKGFKLYMKKVEELPLNLLTPPEKTPELFEKLLPYAIALGVSNEWCKRFNNVLLQCEYRPEWYNHSAGFSAVGLATSFAALGTSFNSSVLQANQSSSGSSSWSSGSSGFSGGGGGGGGGRGW
jgi:uncharacterized membrane protein